jgi:RND superfamily putative drug exporter
MSRLARWCFHHRKLVLAFWLIALVVVGAGSQLAKSDYSTKFQLQNTDSARAIKILQDNFPAVSGDSDQIVIQTRTGTIDDPAVQKSVETMLAKVATEPEVSLVISPYATAGKGQVSKDRTIAFATVDFNAQVQNLKTDDVDRVINTAEAARSSQLNVQLAGQAIENAQPEKSSDSTGLGVLFALIVLGLVFGALFAAVIPLVTALIAIGIGYAFTSLLSHAFPVASFVPILGLLIGLGVGVDYALFIITRHRNALKAGRTIEEAAVQAVNTSGRAVFFAGLTVCIALLGQFALGMTFLYGLAVAGAVTVGLTMFASLTLLPAFLGFFGLRVLSRKERRRLIDVGPRSEELTGGFWFRWARRVQSRRGILSVGSLILVVVIAMPIFSLRLGLADAGSDPPATTTHKAYDLLAEGFGPGFNGPLELVSTFKQSSQLQDFTKVVEAAAGQGGVVAATPPRVAPNGKAAIALLYPSTSPQAAQTSTLLHRLRDTVIPRAESGTGLHVLVGGATAAQDDFAKVLASKLWLFILVVVLVAFVLLMMVFRSLLIPAIASVMNLLSVGAALGIMVAVFQWGWGASLIGIDRTGPVEVFIPVIMFSVLFGLSMDYEVFLVSRMHEEWVRSADNGKAVTRGQTETGRVITAAALIMVLVFLSFLLGGNIIIDQFGIGLAGAIIVDAFVVRTVLVPAIMHLTGKANWWLPGWLDRVLPTLHVEMPDHLPEGTEPELTRA